MRRGHGKMQVASLGPSRGCPESGSFPGWTSDGSDSLGISPRGNAHICGQMPLRDPRCAALRTRTPERVERARGRSLVDILIEQAAPDDLPRPLLSAAAVMRAAELWGGFRNVRRFRQAARPLVASGRAALA